ncbi:hypothetical protein BDY19DRAFT_990236 [Irpex rosettiformis]|uniref:Uncharacterized protein n=1 Tax=Irpex rosettiformis TaxID=378272 RepID=A0ACB8UE18_9APHY|nr:hypothetical protein BDY19DRAFT_990236 [Irpex rosettiformis]
MATVLNNLGHRDLLLAGAFAGLGLFAIYRRYNSSSSTSSSDSVKVSTGAEAPSSTKPALAARSSISPQQHEPGEWKPVQFDYPTIVPSADDPRNIRPVPYRPFKWGEYQVMMGLRTMPWDEWFELDEQFEHYYRIRENRLRTRGERLVQVLPATPGLVNGGHDAAAELVQEMAEYLSRRYPTMYTVKRNESASDSSGWYGLPSIKEITIIPVGKTYKIDEEEPMALAGMLAQDDIAIMIEGSDGQYYLQAGVVLIPGMWRLQDKIGMSMDDIHISGTVPQYDSKLKFGMNRFFTRMPLDKPVTRANYSFQVVAPPDIADPSDPNELSWAKTMKGDEEDEDNKPGYLNAKDDAPYESGGGNGNPAVISDLANSTSAVNPSLVRMRVERETLRRLPRTGAIIFAIRTYQTPLVDLASEPEIPGRLASAIRSWPEDVAVYKARAAYESVLGYLDKQYAAQVAAGLTSPLGAKE